MNTDWNSVVHKANDLISRSINSSNDKETQSLRFQAIKTLLPFLDSVDVVDYLLIDSEPKIPKQVFIENLFNLGTLYKTCAESCTTNGSVDLFDKALQCFRKILRVNFEDTFALQQIVSVYTRLCFLSQSDMNRCLNYLQECLLFAPDNETIHYNLGFVYQKLNKIELSLIHYRLSLKLATNQSQKEKGNKKDELKRLVLNNYNGIAGIYRSIKQWPESLFYLQKAEHIDPSDPDIQNQLGVTFTEMRRTDLAENAYKNALKHYKRSFISSDPNFLLSEIHLNYGHMHAYNGNNTSAIDNYNKALQISPKFTLPFQNKIMNLNYLFDQLEDKMYITNQHKLVNKLYKKGNGMYKFDKSRFQNCKINIGIISGDFVEHPVSFFISTFLKHFDTSIFNVTCYSECIIDTTLFNKNIVFKFIRNTPAQQAADLMFKDNIHILFDLAGHTAFNRMDVFALKPCPIQITYIGYPFSTGLTEMDFRITDSICDSPSISSPFYTETLLYMKNCFLCYDPSPKSSTPTFPQLQPQPKLKNGWITIGCFNRLNKITDSVIKVFNTVMLQFPNIRFVFKTKALLNKNVQKMFLAKFDASLRKRIKIFDCTILHEEHLLEYNKIDLAIDTFPYSGTTTSCEALLMGVPVFTLYDSIYTFHAQNVTASILKNSGLDFFVVQTPDELYTKIKQLESNDNDYWKTLKPNTRKSFLDGKVCNKQEYMTNFTRLLQETYNKLT